MKWTRQGTSIVDEYGRKVAHIGYARKCGTSQRVDYEEQDRNAKLIAAAPELLALAEMVNAGNTDYEGLELAAQEVLHKVRS